MELGPQQPIRVPKEHKEMLSVKKDPDNSNKLIVRINNSSLDIIQTCSRKAFYALSRGLKSRFESEATLYGKAIHAGLESWYEFHDDNAAVEAFNAVAEPLSGLPDTNKRSLANGKITLEHYFTTYREDGFEVAKDKDGVPYIERDVTAVVSDSDILRIEFFGRVDKILIEKKTGIMLVTDHKTTSSLGVDFYNRIRPNFQYTGYTWAAKESLGLSTNQFMVNGIQVKNNVYSGRGRKPGPPQFARQVTRITKQDIAELHSAIIIRVQEYISRGMIDGHWPMSTPNACSMWSGCQFRDICEVSTDDIQTTSKMRESVIKSRYRHVVSDL